MLTALRLAFYPAFEPAEARRFQTLTIEAENARSSGDLAKAESLYSTAVAEAQSSSEEIASSMRIYVDEAGNFVATANLSSPSCWPWLFLARSRMTSSKHFCACVIAGQTTLLKSKAAS